MTKKVTTPEIVSTVPNVDRFNVVNAIKGLIAKGDQYGWATKAAIAHVLATEIVEGKIKRGVAAKLSEETGFNKGDLSRIGRIVTDNAKARKAVLLLDVLHIDDNEATLAEAVKVGGLFKRETVNGKKVTKNGTTTESETTVKSGKSESEEIDVLALMDAWLRGATDSQFAARLSLVTNLLATIESDRATAQAEIDSAEVAA